MTYCTTPLVLQLVPQTGPTLDLMDERNGIRVESVDLGYPNVRDDVVNRANAHGTFDYTKFWADRVVTVVGSAVPSPAGSRTKALDSLGPFLDPGARFVMRFQFDADVPIRYVTLRASAFSAPFTNPAVSAFTVSWKAPDPIIYNVTQQQQAVGPFGAPVYAGRRYSLVFPRQYPSGATNPTILEADNEGSAPVAPLVEIVGPASAVQVQSPAFTIGLLPSYAVPAGYTLTIDSKARKVTQGGVDVYQQCGYRPNGAWPVLPARTITPVTLSASGTTGATLVRLTWNDGYLL